MTQDNTLRLQRRTKIFEVKMRHERLAREARAAGDIEKAEHHERKVANISKRNLGTTRLEGLYVPQDD